MNVLFSEEGQRIFDKPRRLGWLNIICNSHYVRKAIYYAKPQVMTLTLWTISESVNYLSTAERDYDSNKKRSHPRLLIEGNLSNCSYDADSN